MIEWQGSAPVSERAAPFAAVYGRMLKASLIMFAGISVFNVGSWALKGAWASVVLYPVAASWLFFYLSAMPALLEPGPNHPEPFKLGVLAILAMNLPLAYLSTVFLQTDVLEIQATIARTISGPFK